MGILKSLFTLGKSFISQAEESIEETQGVRMLEQHIRDAKAELDKAGKSPVMAWKKQLQRQRSVSLSLSSKWKSLKPLKPCSVHNRL